jgi:hypothetical protein
MAAIQTAAGAASIPARPSPLKGLGLLLGAIVLVAGYLALCGALRNAEYYAGFLFLLCWTGFEQGRLEKLPQTVLGAALGLALGCAMQLLMTGPLGVKGGYVFGALVMLVVYCHVMGWLPLLVNFTTMTFLAVLTISHIQSHGNFGDMTVALAAGIVYFGLVLGIAGRLSARR